MAAASEAVEVEEVDAVEVQTVPQTSTNPAVFGLLAIPAGLLALAMRRTSTPAPVNDVEAPLKAAAVAGAFAAAQPAMAAQQVAEVADNRLGLLLGLLVPALGWVGFNILKPALRQLDNMAAKNEGRSVSPAPKKGRR